MFAPHVLAPHDAQVVGRAQTREDILTRATCIPRTVRTRRGNLFLKGR
jgi:hypothetical protein